MDSRGERNPRNKRTNPERERPNQRSNDLPVVIYQREAATREAAASTPEPEKDTEMTLTVESEKHTGFLIEFGSSHSPKMAKKENLSDFVPKSLKEKMEESSRLAEERRVSRMSRSKSQEFVKSPRESPTSHKRMKELWGSTNLKNSSKATADTEPHSFSGLEKRRKSHGETSNSHHEFSLPKTKRSGQSSSAAATDNGDNVSESGTYTIDSDNPSKEVLEARQNIDEVFGIAKDITSDEDTDKDVSDEEIAEQVVESKSKTKKKPNGMTGKEKWIEEWASSTAEQEQTENQTENISEPHGISYDIDLSSPQRENAKPEKYTSPSRRHQLNSKSRNSPTHLSESPSKGGRSRRLLPATPDFKNKLSAAPPLSPEPKSEPFMSSSKSLFTFPSVQSVPVSETRMMSKSSTKLSVEDSECIDTEILLKDTEVFMHKLEERMKHRQQEASDQNGDEPMAELSDPDDEDADTSEAFETRSNIEYLSSAAPATTNNSVTAPATTNNSVTAPAKKGRTSPSPKQSGIWSRLATPNRHKVASEKEKATPTSKTTPASKTVDNKSTNFQRNTYRTSSLPDKKSGVKKSKETTQAPVKPKQSVLQPRQTRSTMLRKSRFTGSAGNINVVSPASSISDLSSSRASVTSTRKKSLPNISKDKVSCSDSDVGIYTTRKQLNRGQKTTVKADTKTGAKQPIGNRGRSSSVGEHTLKAPPQNGKKKVPASNGTGNSQSASTSVSSRNAANFRNSRASATAGNSRNTSSPSSSIEAYISSVRDRKVENLSSSTSLLKTRRQGDEKQASKKQTVTEDTKVTKSAVTQQTVPTMQSSNFVQNLDHLSKDEKTVDDVLGEDVFHFQGGLPARELKQEFHGRLASRLHRSSSLDLQDEYPKDLTYDRKSSHHRRSGNAPGKRLHFGKTESFDDLVLSSINHLSKKLKDSADQLLTRIKPTNSQLTSYPERDYPFLKTENREIAQILHNLRRMERKLDEIHCAIDEKSGHRSPVGKRNMSPRLWKRTPEIVQSEDGVETSI